MKKVFAVLHLNASHNANGNPRRCYVCIGRDGQAFDAIDEGYEGRNALVSKYPALRDSSIYPIELDTTPAQYRDILRQFAG